MLDRVLSLAQEALAADTAIAASRRFGTAARTIGASYLQTRLYRRPAARLTPQAHWQAGGFVLREARPNWPDSDAFRYICIDCNPLVDAIRQGRTTYRFSDYAPHDAAAYGAYWEAFGEADIGDALCATAYGPNGAVASVHLGFPDRAIDPVVDTTVRMAGLLLVEHLLRFLPDDPAPAPRLTPRERDCLLLVADGKTDWEIGCILGVAEATARFHVDNARRKLGAVNRAHAVARLMVADGHR